MSDAADTPPAAGGTPIVVSGGGETRVATDELFVLADHLRRVAASADEWASVLASLSWLGLPAARLPGAERLIARIRDDAADIAGALDRSAEAYGLVDRYSARAQDAIGGVAGHLAGFAALALLPVILVGGTGAAVEAVLAWLAVQGLRRLRGEPAQDPGDWLRAHSRLISDPAVVALIRTLVSSIDDAGAGLVHLPFPLARALSRSGITGVETSAAGAVILGGLLGVVRESPVRVRQVTADGGPMPVLGRRGTRIGPARGAPAPAPTGVADLLSRVPPPDDERPQVRIDRFDADGSATWVVYIGGTVSWEAAGSGEPWDMASNLGGLAGSAVGREAGSYRAVVDALTAAGVAPGDPVIAVGHSQGGILAARLAADDRFSTAGVVTAGAPIAQVAVPADVPVLRLEHTDDLVPALGGLPAEDPADGHLLVRRELLPGLPPGHGGADPAWVTAHELDGYRETAAMVDRSEETRLVQAVAGVTDVGAATGTATYWRGRRVDPVSPGG